MRVSFDSILSKSTMEVDIHGWPNNDIIILTDLGTLRI